MDNQPKGLVTATATGGSAKVLGRQTMKTNFQALLSEKEVSHKLQGCWPVQGLLSPAMNWLGCSGWWCPGCQGGWFGRGKCSLLQFLDHELGVCFQEESLFSDPSAASSPEVFWTGQKGGLRRAQKFVFQILLPSQLNKVGWERQRKEMSSNDSKSSVTEMPSGMPD